MLRIVETVEILRIQTLSREIRVATIPRFALVQAQECPVEL
jgi:hypothetical protein